MKMVMLLHTVGLNYKNMHIEITQCKRCKYDEFEELEVMNTPMLKCERCGYEMVDEFRVYGRLLSQ
jgi:predicted nucleic-acid-binding Zn-ribbon protein